MGWLVPFFLGYLAHSFLSSFEARARERLTEDAVKEGRTALALARHVRDAKALEVLSARVTALERLNVLAILIQDAGLTIPPEVMRVHLDAVDDVERTDLPPLETLPPEVAMAARDMLREIAVFRKGISEVYAEATEPGQSVH